MPLGHLGLSVPDLEAARAYYDELMPLVDHEPFFATDDQFSYQPVGGKPGTRLFFYPAAPGEDYRAEAAGLQHLAFMVRTRARVQAAHDWAVAQNSEVVHAPREFPEYHPGYWATFWRDPHGFLVEVVCHHDDS